MMEESFLDKIKRVVLVSTKNVFLRDKEKKEEKLSQSKVSGTVSSLDSESSNIEVCYIVDPVFFIDHKMLKNFLKFPYKVEMKLKNSQVNPKVLFEIAKQQVYLKLTQEAFYNLKSASEKWSYHRFAIWKSYLVVCYPKLLNEDKISCCGIRKKKMNREKFKAIFQELSKLKNSVEKNIVLLEMSLSNSLKVGKYLEPWQYYAGQVLKIERYYGYLAFGCGYLRVDPKKGLEILTELSRNNPTIPFSYLVMWEYYYGKAQLVFSLEVAIECFSRVTEARFSGYFNLILVMYIKSLVKLKYFKIALEILRNKYLESNNDLFYLYLFGKICVKSKDLKYLNDGLSALKEVLRSIKDFVKINYWYGVGCFKTGRFLKAKNHFNKVVSNINRNQIKYSIKIQKISNRIENSLNEISSFQNEFENEFGVIYQPTKDQLLTQHFRLAKAEYLLNTGQLSQALEEVYLVKLPEGFKLLQKIAEKLDPEQAKENFVFMLESLMNSKIPIFELLNSCVLYTDFLVSVKSFDSALKILESLLLFYPKSHEDLPFVSKTINICKSGLTCQALSGEARLAVLKKNLRLSLSPLHPNYPSSKSPLIEDLPELGQTLALFVFSDASVLFKIYEVLENLPRRLEDQITCLQDFIEVSKKTSEITRAKSSLMNLLRLRSN